MCGTYSSYSTTFPIYAQFFKSVAVFKGFGWVNKEFQPSYTMPSRRNYTECADVGEDCKYSDIGSVLAQIHWKSENQSEIMSAQLLLFHCMRLMPTAALLMNFIS